MTKKREDNENSKNDEIKILIKDPIKVSYSFITKSLLDYIELFFLTINFQNVCRTYQIKIKQSRNIALFSKRSKSKIKDLLSFFSCIYNIIYKKSYFIYIFTVKKIKVVLFSGVRSRGYGA